MKKIYVLTILFALLSVSVWAQLPYNTTLTQSHYNDSQTVIQKEGTQSWDGGARLGTSTNAWPGDWNDKYIVIALDQTSIPYQLQFKYKITSAIASNPNWYVAESADNSNWVTIWSNESRNTSWSDQQTITLSKSTKYLKLCYSGNYAGIFADIIVSDQAYVNNPKVGDNEITSLDFGANTISSGVEEKTFDIEWCNVNAMTVTSDNAFFAVSPASFGGIAQYGTQTITVGYNRDQEVGQHNGTITITNGSVTKTVTLSGTTTKREQEIHWNANLVAMNFTLNAEDALTGADLATADNEEAVLTYVSDNTEVIAVSEDGQTISAVANGTATITVTATGNDIYNEKVESKVFTVTSDRKQIIVWDQNFMGLKTNADPNTIELTAVASSGGEVTYALEEGSDNCVTLNGNILTITGTPGVAYIIASQDGGEINGEMWIATTARKQIKVRDPQSACDEYALADESFTFAKGDKTTLAEQEFALVGKPTELIFAAKWGGKKYLWSEQQEMMVEQYANFGSGLEWSLVTSFLVSDNTTSYGPFELDETATKIRFRSGEYGEQNVSNISIPRKKEMIVSESVIEETAERNVRWSKTISVSRSNIDVVDITVSENCPFEVSKTSIGTDCADRTTETFEVFFTPTLLDSVYTGTITITDGKADPTTHTISLAITCTRLNQSINGFELPTTCQTLDTVEVPTATATSGLEVVYLSSDSTIAYVENNVLVILSAGTVDIIAYQAGDDRFNEVTLAKTIVIELTPVEISVAPTASQVAYGAPVGMAMLFGGEAEVDGTFSWLNPDQIMTVDQELATVLFTPDQNNIYATATVDIPVNVTDLPITYGIDTIEFCEGDSVEFAGVWYKEASVEPLEITFEGANVYGADSIVLLTVIVHPKEVVTLEETMHEKEILVVDPNEWFLLFAGQEYPMDAETSLLGLEEITIVKHEATEYGCDKKIVRHISITKATVVEVPVDIVFCAGESYPYRDTIYTEAGVDEIFAQGALVDTLYQVTVTVNPTYFNENNQTKTVGEAVLFEQDGWLLRGETPVTGVYMTTKADSADLWFVHNGLTVLGCDSIERLNVTVQLLDPYQTEKVLEMCEGESVEYRGVQYSIAGEYPVEVEDAVRDTVVNVIVTVHPKEFVNSEEIMNEKETLVVVPGEWNILIGDVEYPLNEAETSLLGWEEITLVKHETTEFGCEKTTTRHITVTKSEIVEVPVALSFCEGGSVAYRDTIYTEAGMDQILVKGETADTLYKVTITVNMPYYNENNETKNVGEAVLFEQDGWLLRGETPVTGAYTITKADTMDLWFVYYGLTVQGCDSVERLNVAVELLDPYQMEKELDVCEGESVEYRGVQYSIAGEYPVLVEDAVRDTLINVIVTVHEKAYAEIERTVLAGEVLTLPEGEWHIGDQVVSGTYETLRSDTLGLEFYQYDVTEFGCESVVKLIVTVTPNHEAIENVKVGEKAEKFFQNGTLYIRRGEMIYTITGELVE